MVLGELALDPAQAAEVGRGALVHMALKSAAMADAPAPAAKALALLARADTSAARAEALASSAGARWPAPAIRGLVHWDARLPEDEEVEEETAVIAAARACRGRSLASKKSTRP